MIVQTEAIVVKSFDFRETSRIVTFFTRERGRMSGVLKGIRKDLRKFNSSVELFSVNDIVYYEYRNSDLHLVSQCDLKEYFYGARQDLKRTMAATYALELIYKIMPVEAPNHSIYRLLLDFFASLADAKDVDKLVRILQIKILLHSGFRPHLDACVKTQKKIEGRALFSLKDGGLIRPEAARGDPHAHPISAGAVASILHVERSDWQQCLRLRLSQTIKKELKYILNNFLVYHLGRRIRSAQYVG